MASPVTVLCSLSGVQCVAVPAPPKICFCVLLHFKVTLVFSVVNLVLFTATRGTEKLNRVKIFVHLHCAGAIYFSPEWLVDDFSACSAPLV